MGGAAVTEQVRLVKAAYAYLYDTTVDWTAASGTAEYAVAVAALDKCCIQVAVAYAGTISEYDPNVAISHETVVKEINNVYTFVTGCNPSSDTEGYADFWAILNAKNEEATERFYSMIVEFPAADVKEYDKQYASARQSIVDLHKQINTFPITNKALMEKYSKKAYDATEYMLGLYEAFLDSFTWTNPETNEQSKINDLLALPTVEDTTIGSIENELRSLKKLCDDGILSEEEFDEKKKQLLNL